MLVHLLGVGIESRKDLIHAPLIKKCAILASGPLNDQCYTENYDECCAMLRVVTKYVGFSAVGGTSYVLAAQSIIACFVAQPRFQEW